LERKYRAKIYKELQRQRDELIETGTFTSRYEDIFRELYGVDGLIIGTRQYELLTASNKQKSVSDFFSTAWRVWMEVFVQTRMAQKIVAIDTTTREAVQEVLRNNVGVPFDKIVEQLKMFDRKRAMRIARTEVAQMANESQRQAAMAWKEEVGEFTMYKIWMHRGAKDPRAHHVALDGVAIPESEQFQIVDEYGVEYADYPHAENLSARNVVNCSCTVTYVSEAYVNQLNGVDTITEAPQAPQASETVTIEDLPPSTEQTINQDLADVFKDLNINIDEKSIVYDSSLSLKDKNELKNYISKLVREYKMDIDVGKHRDVKLSFKSKGNNYGYVISSRIHISEINFGHLTPEDSALKESVFRTTSKGKKVIRFTRSAIVDAKNTRFSTLVHEFAHIITDESRTLGSSKNPTNIKFWKELKKIREDYYSELNRLIKIRDVESLNKMYISQYAQTNINEFMAESFMQYKLNSNPSPYAVRVGKLIDKYFKK